MFVAVAGKVSKEGAPLQVPAPPTTPAGATPTERQEQPDPAQPTDAGSDYEHSRTASRHAWDVSLDGEYSGGCLCSMKMLPVLILAKHHSSTRSAVSEHATSSARLVFERSNSSIRQY